MKSFRLAIVCGLVATLGLTAGGMPAAALAQTEFQLALRKKYNFKTVTCAACHPNIKDKTERNEFGTLLAKELKAKNVTKRLDEVKDLDLDNVIRMKVREEVTKEFLEALPKVEMQKSAGGETFGDLLKAGKLEGVKLRD